MSENPEEWHKELLNRKHQDILFAIRLRFWLKIIIASLFITAISKYLL